MLTKNHVFYFGNRTDLHVKRLKRLIRTFLKAIGAFELNKIGRIEISLSVHDTDFPFDEDDMSVYKIVDCKVGKEVTDGSKVNETD